MVLATSASTTSLAPRDRRKYSARSTIPTRAPRLPLLAPGAMTAFIVFHLPANNEQGMGGDAHPRQPMLLCTRRSLDCLRWLLHRVLLLERLTLLGHPLLLCPFGTGRLGFELGALTRRLQLLALVS